MLVLACLQHWYTSVVFFGPIPIVGLFIWINGRRESRTDSGERVVERDGHVPV
jgi:hypothetical protein